MLSASSIFQEIKSDPDAFRFFVSVAAKGETQGGWENGRIAELLDDEVLRPKVLRHGEDESKHGRIFRRLLEQRGLRCVEVAPEADYCMHLERWGIGLSHRRLETSKPLSEEEVISYLVHSRVTEQRAAEEVDLMVKLFGDDPDIGPAVRMIADDEINHLSYCHEELLRLSAEGWEEYIRRMLEAYAKAEIKAYRKTSLAFVDRMADILSWNPLKKGLLKLGVHAKYFIERLVTWRRMVRLAPPVRPGALG